MRTLTDRIRWWIDDRLPEPRQKRWAAVMAAAMVVCGGWILVFAVGTVARAGSGGDGATVPESPQVKLGHTLTKRLRDDSRFAEVSITPHVDYPERLRAVGRVRTKGDLTELNRRLSEIDTAKTVVVDVLVVEPGPP